MYKIFLMNLVIYSGIKFQFNHSMYVGIEAYTGTDTVILEDLHLYAYCIRLHHSSFNYIYLHFMI